MSNESDSKTEQNEEEVLDLFDSNMRDADLLGAATEAEAQGDEQETGEADDEKSAGDDNLPEKYRGKSIEDVIGMHQNLEKAYGRHNNELGELRQLTDTILKQQLGETKAAETEALDSEALLENPTDSINATVEANPKLRELEAKLTARERADNLQAFNRQHPNAKETVNDPRFLAWVEQSPTRMRLLQQANESYDYELAGEILTTYQSLNPAESGEAERTETKAAMSNAKPSSASGGGKKAKIFKRADIMRLRIEDPDRYDKLWPELEKAYAENRVR